MTSHDETTIDRLAAARLHRRDLLRLATVTGLGGALTLRGLGRAVAQDAPAGEVTYWHHFTSETEMVGMDRVLELFKTANPGVEVVPETIPNADYMAKFTSASLAGSLPDTAMVAVDRLPDMWGMDAVLPLTDRIDAWDLRDAFGPNIWQGATIEEEIYGVPAFMFVDWLYYRKDWFDEAGIAGPPTTWEEFVDAAVKLTDSAQGRYGFGMRGGDGGEGIVIQLFQAFGSPIVDDQGCAALETAKVAEALKSFTEIFTVHKAAPPSAPGDSFRQLMEAFKTGQTGMLFHHTGSLTEIVDVLGDKVMTAPRPVGPAGIAANISPLFNGMTKEENADAAWAWLTQWGQVESEVAFLEETGYFPPNSQVAEDERVSGNELYAAAIETMGAATLPPQFAGSPGWAKQTVLPVFQQVLLGEKTPEQAADEIAEGLKTATGC
ncbi:MAG: ABC transporter substrate-binding protein [Thermomicrobiales bacterium]